MAVSRRIRRSGTAFIQDTPKIERGIITAVYCDSLSCDVSTETKKNLVGLPLPDLIQFPGAVGGHVEVPEVGTSVVVQLGVGRATILGYYNHAAGASIFNFQKTDNASTRYRVTAPAQLNPGDWVQFGDRGQYFAVFRGGMLHISAAPWTQIALSSTDEQLNIIGRKLKISTAMGDITFDESSGKQALHAHFGTDLRNETADERWTYWFDINADGVRFEITTPDGTSFYKRSIDPVGNSYEINNGNNTQQCRNKSVVVNGDWTCQNVNTVFAVENGFAIDAHGTVNVSGDTIDARVVNGFNLFSNRDIQLRSGRTINISATGPIPALPGTASVKWNVTNGSFVVDVGLPGIADPALSGVAFNLFSPGGEVQFNNLLGRVLVNTALPDSVILGGNFITSHVVKWELGLQTFLESLLLWLGTHIHNATAEYSPTSPPVASPNSLRGLLSAIPSLRVGVGA